MLDGGGAPPRARRTRLRLPAGAGHREPPRDGPHLHGRARGGSPAGLLAPVPHRRCRQPLLSPLLPAGGGQRVLLWPLGRAPRGPGGGAPLRRGRRAGAAMGGLDAGHHPHGARGPPGLRAGARGRARAEVERLNAEVTGTLTRLQAAQQELVVAERMATVGRLSLKVAHEVRNPIAAIELNAEMLGDIVSEHPHPDMNEAVSLLGAIREQVTALDALTEEYLAFARFPRPQFEEDSVNKMVAAVAEFVRPLATRQGISVRL